MKNIILILMFGLVSCSAFNQGARNSAIRKLTFSVESIIEEIPSKTNQVLSYILNDDKSKANDSFYNSLQELMKIKLENESKFPNEIYIEAIQNGWTKQRYINNAYTDYINYNSAIDSISILSYQNKDIIGSYKIVKGSSTCTIENDKSKLKTIHGYQCYFIKIEEFSNDETFLNHYGSTIYEMWVTEKINFPIYTLLKIDCNFTGFFPLQTKIYQSNSLDKYYQYTIKNIE